MHDVTSAAREQLLLHRQFLAGLPVPISKQFWSVGVVMFPDFKWPQATYVLQLLCHPLLPIWTLVVYAHNLKDNNYNHMHSIFYMHMHVCYNVYVCMYCLLSTYQCAMELQCLLATRLQTPCTNL